MRFGGMFAGMMSARQLLLMSWWLPA